MIGQHCLTHSHKLIIGKLISASNWHLVHLFNLQDLGPTLGPKSGRVEIKLYKKKWTQGIAPKLELSLQLEILAPLALVAKMATRWRHLH